MKLRTLLLAIAFAPTVQAHELRSNARATQPTTRVAAPAVPMAVPDFCGPSTIADYSKSQEAKTLMQVADKWATSPRRHPITNEVVIGAMAAHLDESPNMLVPRHLSYKSIRNAMIEAETVENQMPPRLSAKNAGPFLMSAGYVNLMACPDFRAKYVAVTRARNTEERLKHLPEGAILIFDSYRGQRANGYYSPNDRNGDAKIRTKKGCASNIVSPDCRSRGRALIGVYIKPPA